MALISTEAIFWHKKIIKNNFITFLEPYINQVQNQKPKGKFNTHFLGLITFRKKREKYWQIYCTFFESYSSQRQILMHTHNCEQFYWTFLDFCSGEQEILTFTHFLDIISIRNISFYKREFSNCIFTHILVLR